MSIRCLFGKHDWLPKIWTGHNWLFVCKHGCIKWEEQ